MQWRARIGLCVALAAALQAAGCASGGPSRPAEPPRESVESLWDLAPRDASGGIVVREGAISRLLAVIAGLGKGAARKEIDGLAKRRAMDALESTDGWALAGLDPSGGAAAFSWPEKGRGVLLVLPVIHPTLFRTVLRLRSHVIDGREVDELGDGYSCTTAAGHYLCARSIDDIAAAAAPHGGPLAPEVARLSPDDRGDLELYADVRAPEIARLAEQSRALGRVTAVAASIRLRDDGASGRIHVIGEMDTPLARSLAGAPPPHALAPTPAGAPSLVRVHVDIAALIPPSTHMEPRIRSELVDQLIGDLELTTSGHGVLGLWAAAPLKSGGRVEALVKALCKETGGAVRRIALDKIAVREHGCTAVLDPSMMPLLPLTMSPVALSADVVDQELVVTVGDAVAPRPPQRSSVGVAKNSDAVWALEDAETLVAFTRSPWIGPDSGAGRAFKAMVSILDDDSAAHIDEFNDLATRVAQALLAVKVAEDGVMISGDVVTFAGDPPEARAAYEAALELRATADIAGYRARLGEIERRYPGTLAAQRAVEVRGGSPFFGAGSMLVSALGSGARKGQ